MVLETFALLAAGPIHKQAIPYVNFQNRDDHIAENTEGRHSTQQSNDQSQSAEEFRHDGEEGEYRRNSAVLEKAHGGGETVSAPPSKDLLSTVGEEHDSQNQTQNREGGEGPGD